MIVGSLFTGIGSLDRGLERAGMRVVWQCEADPDRRSVLRRVWPAVPIYEQVETLRRPARVDVLAAGFPCQDVSDSGLRAGIEGEHSGLWAHVARLVRELRPRYLIVENVPGLLARGMGRVVGDLAASGYDAEWDVLPAAAFGAPHLRARVWLVAYPGGQRSEALGTVFAGRPLPEPDPGWDAEPSLARVAARPPGWMVRALGDTLVPQIAEYLGRRVMEAE
jgi:DNA (cytosine-5)-methyltransferase 1